MSDLQLTTLRTIHKTLYERIEHCEHAYSQQRPTTIKCPQCTTHPKVTKATYPNTPITLDTRPACSYHRPDVDELHQVAS